MSTAVTAERASPVARVKDQFEARRSEFALALPKHIPVDRFVRVVMTAVQRNPDLANVDRVSLFNSSLLAAQDGLLPDGREGALVIYNTKVKGKNGEKDEWVQAVQWMPMIAGVLKKARNSGDLSSIEAHLVYKNDPFEFTIGVDDIPRHSPDWFGGDRGKVVGVYAFAKLKDGTRQCEVMSFDEVEKVRSISRAKESGPWVAWWGEMARKTVLRRLLKRLPTSTDLDDLIRRDDALYDFDGAREEAKKVTGGSLASRMASLASPPAQSRAAPAQIDHDPATSEIAGAQQSVSSADAGAPSADDARGADNAHSGNPQSADEQIEAAFQRGMNDRAAGVKRRAVPGDFRDAEDLSSAWERGWDEETGGAA